MPPTTSKTVSLPKVIAGLSPNEQLGLTIIGEGRGEPIQGQVAIGCVIRNRLHYLPATYHSYADVIFEPMQFSCWLTKDPNFAFLTDIGYQMVEGQRINDPYLRQCLYVAAGIADWTIIDNTGGARFYLENSLFNGKRPSWANNAKDVRVIGKQTFFNI